MQDKLKKAVGLYGFKGIHPAANLMPMMSEELPVVDGLYVGMR